VDYSAARGVFFAVAMMQKVIQCGIFPGQDFCDGVN
jgi:hypothetical protein